MSKKSLTNMNEVIAAYQAALADWRAGNLDTARSETEHIRRFVSAFPKLTLLEAFIARDKKEFITEINILQRCLNEEEQSQTRDPGLASEAWSMIGSAFHELGNPKESINAFSRAVEIEPELAQRRVEASNLIFTANCAENYSSEDFRILYRRYEALLAPIVPFSRRTRSHHRLRIGYLSADFCGHPVGKLILPLLEHHDKKRFETFCYNAGNKEDGVTKKLREASEHWRNIGSVSDEETARMIYDDEIDILVELGVHTKGNRLPVLAYRPATVQICGIGDVRSSGLSCVDYFLSDIWCAGDKASTREDFAEHVIRLPHTHFCYIPPENLPTPTPPPCLTQGFVTFGCFNNASKITDEMMSAWSKLMERVPKSRLLLKHKLFDSEEGRQFTQKRMMRLGFDLSRVELRGFSQGHIFEYADMDVALDTYPYTGGMTTFEALSMGVPVVTRYGTRHGTRFGYSILQNLGLGELAAPSIERYIETATALAEDKELLSMLRKKLRNILSTSPLANAAQYASDVEAAYETVWKKSRKEDSNLKTIVIATKNNGKIREMTQAFEGLPVKLLPLSDFGELPDAVEDGKTFEENAKIKARFYMTETKTACLADDSGLETEALGGAPGVYSARFAGEHAGDEANNQKLLAEIAKKGRSSSPAAYRCVLAFADTDGTVLTADGSCEGVIRPEAKGNGGFGYDPYFYIEENKTMAELTLAEKDAISHRGKALRQMASKLADYLKNAKIESDSQKNE